MVDDRGDTRGAALAIHADGAVNVVGGDDDGLRGLGHPAIHNVLAAKKNPSSPLKVAAGGLRD
jgi:hypothetical protein